MLSLLILLSIIFFTYCVFTLYKYENFDITTLMKRLDHSNDWENGDIKRIKLTDINLCVDDIIYHQITPSHVNKGGIGVEPTGNKMIIGECSEKNIKFKKIGDKLNIMWNDDNECLVYHKPHIIGYADCSDKSDCFFAHHEETGLLDVNNNKKHKLPLCSNFTPVDNKIVISKFENKCLNYLGDDKWNHTDCSQSTRFEYLN